MCHYGDEVDCDAPSINGHDTQKNAHSSCHITSRKETLINTANLFRTNKNVK